eukprot:tig00021582_g22636.t1
MEDLGAKTGKDTMRGYGNGCSLSWENLSYTIPVKVKGQKKKQDKPILREVSGDVQPGHLLAIMGPSGGGKTSLLNVLAGRAGTSKTLTGEILLNGRPRDKYFKRIAGYVLQDDVLRSTLTVKETLMFAAELRLPEEMGRTAKEKKVMAVIQELGLTKVVDTRIGDALKRGISGGERKRVSIGCELLTSPMILFLDEPTSGLDSTAALTLMQTLLRLAKHGRTVVTTIHQPRSNIFALFDKLILMSQGRVVYAGTLPRPRTTSTPTGTTAPPSPVRPAASAAPAGSPAYGAGGAGADPADFFIDVISEDSVGAQLADTHLLYRREPGKRPSLPPPPQARVDPGAPAPASGYLAGASGPAVVDLQGPGGSTSGGAGPGGALSILHDVPALQGDSLREYANSWGREFWILLRQQLLADVRNPFATTIQLVQAIFLSVFIGLIYLRLGYTITNSRDRIGVLFFVIPNQAFGAMASLTLFLQERELFVRETAAGAYRPSTFFMAKSLTEVPQRVIFPFIFGTILYWMTGLNPAGERYILFVITVILIAAVASSYVSAVGALTGNVAAANAIAPIFIVIMMLFGGFFITFSSIPKYFIWIEYLSFFKYAYESFIRNEFEGATFCDPAPGACITGESVIRSMSLSERSVGVSLLILLGMVVAYRLLAFFFLRRLARKRT